MESIDLRQIEAFVAAMSTGSITGAAKVMGRSQPVVTRLIQELERELGFDLFARHGRGIAPTQNGALFYKEADRLLSSVARTKRQAADIVRRQTQMLEIAATASLAATVVPNALALLKERGLLPSNVLLRSQLPDDVIQSVIARDVDLGVASMPMDHPGLEVHWIAEASCVCVLLDSDPLAKLDIVKLRDLEHRALIMMSNPYRVLGRVSAALQRSRVDTSSIITTNSSVTATRLVHAGLGIALLEPMVPAALPLPGLAVRPLDVDVPYLWGIVTPLGQPASPIITPLIDALIKAASDAFPRLAVRDVRDRDGILKTMYADEQESRES